MKRVSVIIPVYNRLEHLRVGIRLLKNQTLKPYELVIADDGSSENVIDTIKDLLDGIDFKVKYVSHEDLGFRKTRIINEAVKRAEGEILAFCDQDLIFPEDYLEKIVFKLEKDKFLMGRASFLTEEEKEKFLLEFNQGKSYEESSSNFNLNYKKEIQKLIKKDKFRIILKKLRLKKRGLKLVGMSFALYKESFIKINGYDEKYQGWGYEDDDLGNRLIVSGVEGKNLETGQLLYHLWHPEAPSKKESLNKEYYYKRKKEVLKEGKYKAEYGYDNSFEKDEVKGVAILK